MTKTDYFSLASRQSVSWLRACIANPSSGMSATHIRLLRLALRKKGNDLEAHYAELSASYAKAA